MADREETLKLKIELDNAQTVEQLEQVLESINEQLVLVDENSDAFEDLSEMAGDATEELDEVNSSIEDLNGQTSILKGGMEGLDKVTQMFGVSTGKLTGFLKGAGSSITTLGGKMKVAGTSTGFLSKAMRVLKIAIAATGIGLLVLALGALVTFFTKTQRGADLVSKAMAGIKATIDVVIDRISLLGEGLIKLFTGDIRGAINVFKDALSGIGDEIREETKAAISLEASLQKLEQRENDLIVVQAERQKQIAALRLEAEESAEDFQKGSAAIRKAMELERQMADDNISILKERSRILNEQLSLGESTREELREGQEAIAAVINAETARDTALKSLSTRLRAFSLAQQAANKAIKEFRDIQSEAEVDELELEIDEEGQFVEDGMERLQSEGKAIRAEEQRQADLDQEQREENAIRQLEFDEFVADKTEELELNSSIARQQIAMDLYSSLLTLTDTFFGEGEEQAKKAFEFNKAVQLAETIVTTILSAQKAYASQLIPGDPTSLVRAQIAAGIAIAGGLARVAAIQRTKFNSKTVEDTSTGTVPSGGGQSFNVEPIVPIIDTDLARQTTRVFVTETDITDTVNNVDTIIQKATVVQ